MRWLIDGLIVTMLLAILLVLVVQHRRAGGESAREAEVAAALDRLRTQLLYRAAMETTSGEQAITAAYPREIAPGWFTKHVPANPFAGSAHPWIDVAPEGDTGEHPPDPVLLRPDQAGFWYNPEGGVLRARVPAQMSERGTLDLYNRLNHTALTALPRDPDPAREPRVPESMRRPLNATEQALPVPDAAASSALSEIPQPTPATRRNPRRPSLLGGDSVAAPQP